MKFDRAIQVCRCGHYDDAHAHHTRASDTRCGLCPCIQFRNRNSVWSRLVRWFS